MKIVKKSIGYVRTITITLFVVFFTSSPVLSAESPLVEPTTQEISIPEEKIEKTSEDIKKSEKPAESKEATTLPVAEEKKDEKELWSDHLQSLLTKSAFWDTDTNTPTVSWQDDAYTYAQAQLKKDISAEELKTAFFNTVESKFTNVENVSNLKGFFGVIDSFNKKIEEFVSELTPKEQNKEIELTNSEKDISSTTGQIQEGDSGEPEEKTEEETTQQSEATDVEKAQTKKKKQEAEWQECLKNIRTEGNEEREVEIIVENTISAAKVLLDSTPTDQQSEKSALLKKELHNALNERDPSLYTIDATLVLKQFEKVVITQSAQPQEAQAIMPFITPAKKNGKKTLPTRPEEVDMKQTQKEKSTTESVQPTVIPTAQSALPSMTVQQNKIPTMTGATVPNIQAQIAEKVRAEELLKMKEYQEMLAKKIKMAALEKAAAEKAEAEKGILTKVAETVFGEWWAPKTHQKTLEHLQKEQDDVIDQIIKNKFDKNTKEQIKAAYRIFQKTLLSFNSTAKKYWDPSTNTPTQKWIKDLLSPVEKVLLKLDVLTIDSIITSVKDTLNTKMRAKEYEEIIETITQKLHGIMEKIDHEESEVQRLKALEVQQQQEELVKRQVQAQELATLEEKKQQLAAIQQQKENSVALQRFTKLQKDWELLMQQIRSAKKFSKENLQEFNAAITQKALGHTRIMLELAAPAQKNQLEIVEKHIADFSNALIAQSRNNADLTINIYEYIHEFNNKVHVK